MLPSQLQSAPFGSTARAPVPNTGLSIPEDFRCCSHDLARTALHAASGRTP